MKRIIEEEKRRRQKEGKQKDEEPVEDSDDDAGSEEEEDEEIKDDWKKTPEAVTKYKVAAEIANKTIAAIIGQVVPGKKILELAEAGDTLINNEVKIKYTKGDIEKGIAFPTCVSVNNCVGHYSPLTGEALALQEGDVVKIDLAVHIDGYIASVAHTVIATTNKTEPATGRKADVICAAHVAAEAALRLLRPGNKNTQVTETIASVAAAFKCNPIEGVLSHQVKRFIIDGEKVIINKTTLDQKVDEFTFEEGEAYTVDIVMSTGDGKPKEQESRTTVFKRAPDAAYSLKLKASHYVMNEINKNFPALPFTLRAFNDEKRAKMGIVELVKHDLVHSYPVLFEKPGEFVAQTKFTVLLLPSQISRITSHAAPYVKSELSVTDEKIKQILALGTKRTTDSKKAKKKKKKKAAAPALVPADADKPADKPAEKPAEKPADKPAETPADTETK